MTLNAMFEVNLNRVLIIELFNDPKEFLQTVSIIKSSIKHLDLVHHLNEFSHDERKNSNSKQEEECPHHSFKVTHWIIVPKPYRCETSECKVDSNNGLLSRGLLVELKLSDEVVWILSIVP